MTLIDGNSTFYPLMELSGSAILKEPQWKNLFQIKCYSQSIISQGDSDSYLTNNLVRVKLLINLIKNSFLIY